MSGRRTGEEPHIGKYRSLLDSRGGNGHSLGAIFHQPGWERRTVCRNNKDHLCSIILRPIRWQGYDTLQIILGILRHHGRVSSSYAPVAGIYIAPGWRPPVRCFTALFICLNNFELLTSRLLKTIGKGNFAKVKLAKHIPTGKEVAIKIIDKTQVIERI